MELRRLKPILVIAFLFLCYGASRLCGLTRLPIFVDEGIHIKRAAEIWGGDLWKPLAYGKLLQILFTSLVVRWAPDPLWMSRFITVVFGALAMWACYEIGKRLYNERVGLLSAGLFILSPFTLFFDRMALADGILSSFAALTLLWSIGIVQKAKKRYIYLLGLSLVFGILTKISGLFLLLTPLLTWMLLEKRKELRSWWHLGTAYGLALGLSAYPVWVFFRETEQLAEKSIIAGTSLGLRYLFTANIQMAFEWLWTYWTPPVLVLAMLGLLIALIKRQRSGILLAILAFFPIFAFSVASNIWFPRYILFTTVPLLVLASWSLIQSINLFGAWIKRRSWQFQWDIIRIILYILSFAVICFTALRIDYHLWSDIAQTPLPKTDRIVYIEEWPSGYGVLEAARYLRQETASHPEGILVIYPFGGDAIQFGLWVYMMHEHRVTLKYLNLHDPGSFSTLSTWAKEKPTFILLHNPSISSCKEEDVDMEKLLSMAKLVRSYPKPGGKRSVEIYQVKVEESPDR